MKEQRVRSPEERGEIVYFGFRRVPAAEKVKLVQRHFNTVAAKYDLLNTILSFGLQHLWKRKAIKMLGLSPGERVVDVCGGTADLAIFAAKIVGASARVILYDFNWAMMEAGKPKVVDAALTGRIWYVQGDAEQLSLVDQSFDAAVVGFGIRNLTHMERGFQEMHRVLKPGGKLMCLEFSKPTARLFRWIYDLYSFSVMPLVGKIFVGSWQAYTYLVESIRMFPQPEELTAILERIGFSRVRYHRFTNGIAVVHLGIKT